ncbi:MAG TPA: tail fiber protein [Pseudolabrys sp.]|jgi:microcystin-dependent protein
MAQPFLGQIQAVGFNFAPRGWALCNGQLLAINQNQALFSLLGTQYGGNGTSTFALPNLQSRVPMHAGTFLGNQYTQGEQAGEEAVQLNINQMPAHNHSFSGTTSSANDKRPKTGAAFATSTKIGPTTPGDSYYGSGPLVSLNAGTVQTFGLGQPHTNLQPFLTINFIIALQGIFPSRN